MALKCGIVGLPNVGKSTLFNCLSNAKAQSANFPFCTIEPNVGVISVPDDRLTRLVEMCSPRSVVPATVEIVDIAGLVKGASRGEGLGNKFLANIRETDAILHVLRCFDDDNITHVDGSVDPVRDKEIIDYELLLKDMETVDSRLARTIKQAQTGGDKTARMQADVLQSIKEALEQGKPARSVSFDTPDEQKFVRELFLLTSKPVLYVCNVDDASAATGNAYVDAVREAIASEGASLMVIAAQTESEISELDTYEERAEFLESIGLAESGVSRLIRAAYALLDLQTYFTAGPDEVRAWTFIRGSKAPRCAGIIHTDFEKGFIRAEVIKYGVIWSEGLFERLKAPIRPQLEMVIARCVEIKRDVVQQDEFDTGVRGLLNFGHTIGHAVEKCSDFAVSHGRAVAIGMALITKAAYLAGICEKACVDEMFALLRQYGLPVSTKFAAEELLSAMRSDKKRAGNSITLVLPEAIGKCRLEKLPVEEMRAFLCPALEDQTWM